MNDLIQSLPSPSAYTGNYSHMDGESWMLDGEALAMTMAMISSNSLSRQGARTEFLNPELGFSMVAELRNSFWKTSNLPRFFRLEVLSSRKGRPERCPRWAHHTYARPRGARLGMVCPLEAHLRLVFWLRGSSGKIGTLHLFRVIS